MVSVTSLSDIAGQVTESALNADKVTVGSICLPAGTTKSIRSSIPVDFPKWRNARDDHVAFIVDLMLQEAWSICAASLDKTTSTWSRFWEDSRDIHAKTASLNGGSIGILKAATLIKLILFGQASAMALAHSIKAGTLPKIHDRKGRLHVSESAIFDNEIHGHDNRDAMVDAWRAMNGYQPKLNSLGIHHEVATLSLLSETSEPLLLLPDYVAGILQANNSAANTVAHSQVSQATVSRALERLKASPKFYEFEATLPSSYFEIFPDFKQYSRKNAP